MKWSHVVPALVLLSLGPLARAGTPHLTTRIDGVDLELSGVTDRGGLAAGPQRITVDEAASWRLEIDLRADVENIRWSPAYTIRRVEERKLSGDPAKPWLAEVQIRHFEARSAPASKELIGLLADWPEGLPNGGVVIAAWIVGDKVTDVVPLVLPSTTREDHFSFAAAFRLSDAHARSGQPVLLLWRDGSFARTAPLYADATMSAALVAVHLDDPDGLARVLPSGTGGDSREQLGLIHYAANAGSTPCLKLLLSRAAKSAGRADGFGWSPLHYAASQGRLSAVQALLDARVPLSSTTTAPLPLILAIDHGHARTVALLTAKGAAAAARKAGADPLTRAIRRGFVDIADLLVGAKLSHDFNGPAAGRELLVSAVKGNLSMVAWLVAHGVNANADIRGATALRLAAQGGDGDSARALIKAGAQVEKAMPDGVTPLLAACRAGNLDYAQVLLDAGADPRAVTAGGFTALHLAAMADNEDLVQRLLARGAAIDARTKTETSPLEAALLAGCARAARLLASHGATISLRHPAAEAMLTTAVQFDIAEVIQAALREGWPAESTFAGIWPAARVAELFHAQKCMEALAAAGAPKPDPTVPLPVVSPRELDQPPRLERRGTLVDPRDPEEEFPETTVRLSMLIDAEGRPLFPRVEDAADPRLAQAALETAHSMRFSAVRQQGRPVAVRATVPLVYAASDQRSYEIERVTQIPVPVFQVPPAYPAALGKRGVTGRVELAFVVGTDGKTHDVEVVSATHPAFGEAAVAAVAQWIFKPGAIDGQPVNTRMKQPLAFTLN